MPEHEARLAPWSTVVISAENCPSLCLGLVERPHRSAWSSVEDTGPVLLNGFPCAWEADKQIQHGADPLTLVCSLIVCGRCHSHR
eukprot:scaffold170219_cov45-Prasinocladus_malaysianus.AAC.2